MLFIVKKSYRMSEFQSAIVFKVPEKWVWSNVMRRTSKIVATYRLSDIIICALFIWFKILA